MAQDSSTQDDPALVQEIANDIRNHYAASGVPVAKGSPLDERIEQTVRQNLASTPPGSSAGAGDEYGRGDSSGSAVLLQPSKAAPGDYPAAKELIAEINNSLGINPLRQLDSGQSLQAVAALAERMGSSAQTVATVRSGETVAETGIKELKIMSGRNEWDTPVEYGRITPDPDNGNGTGVKPAAPQATAPLKTPEPHEDYGRGTRQEASLPKAPVVEPTVETSVTPAGGEPGPRVNSPKPGKTDQRMQEWKQVAAPAPKAMR